MNFVLESNSDRNISKKSGAKPELISSRFCRNPEGYVTSIRLDLSGEKPYGVDRMLTYMNNDIYLISDIHLTEDKERTNKIVTTINNTVEVSDTLLILGDMLGHEMEDRVDLIMPFINRLNCRNIGLVMGNHDMLPVETYVKCGFSMVTDKLEWQRYIFTHIPVDMNKEDTNKVNVHGHLHNEKLYWNFDQPQKLNYADVYSEKYVPIKLKILIRNMEKGLYKPNQFQDTAIDSNDVNARLTSLQYELDMCSDSINESISVEVPSADEISNETEKLYHSDLYKGSDIPKLCMEFANGMDNDFNNFDKILKLHGQILLSRFVSHREIVRYMISMLLYIGTMMPNDYFKELIKNHRDSLKERLRRTKDNDDYFKALTYMVHNGAVHVVTEAKKEPSEAKVYVVCCHYKSWFGGIVRGVTGSKYNHSAISLSPDMNTMYTFSREMTRVNGHLNPEGGFNIESQKIITDRDRDTEVKIIEIPVNRGKYNALKEKLDHIGKFNTTNYSTLNLFNILFGNEIPNGKLEVKSMVCSEFVAYVLHYLGVKLPKPVNLMTPEDLSKMDGKNNCKVVFDGIFKKYKPSVVTESVVTEACRDLDTARKFVSEVGKLAKKYDANYFIVTDGASGTSNRGNPAVKHARESQIEWEKNHGFDPDEDWSDTIKENFNSVTEAKLSTKERNDLKDDDFGLPSERKYPMPDKSHVLDAIKFFNYCPEKDRAELAKNIIKKIDKFFDDGEKMDIHVGEKNAFKNYWKKPDSIVSEVMNMLESYVPVMEAPKNKEDEDDITATDYTEDEEDTGEDVPEDDTEGEDDMAAADYTADDEGEEDTGEDTTADDTATEDEPEATEDTPEDDTTTDDTGEETPEDDTTGEEDTGEDETTDDTMDIDEEPADYTDDTGADDVEGEDTGEDTTTDDTGTDTETTDDTGSDETSSQNNIIKNYNLMLSFETLSSSVTQILANLETVVYQTKTQNDVLRRVIDNLRRLEDDIVEYIQFSFSKEYKVNLYYYNIYLQAVNVILGILRKNNQLGDTQQTK